MSAPDIHDAFAKALFQIDRQHEADLESFEHPLQVDAKHGDFICDAGDKLFAAVGGNSVEVRQARARRIAACLNACRDIDTRSLEQIGVATASGLSFNEMEKRLNALAAAVQLLVLHVDAPADHPEMVRVAKALSDAGF